MSGYFPVDHGDIAHQVFGGERRLNRWEAYCWLLDHAAFDQTEVAIKGKPVKLDRGQLALSVGALAKAWKWPRSSVQRFIEGLEREGFIVHSPVVVPASISRTRTHMVSTVITLCKYSKNTETAMVSDTSERTERRTDGFTTQYRDSYVKKEESKKGRKVRGTSVPSSPTTPIEQPDLLRTAEVVRMPTDDVQIAFEAYRAVAKELGLAVPMHRLEGKRRSELRRRLVELDGLEGWKMALGALREAGFITSGGWKGFSIDDMVTRSKLEKLLAGGYSQVFSRDRPINHIWEATLRHREEHPEDSFFHDFDQNGALKHR